MFKNDTSLRTSFVMLLLICVFVSSGCKRSPQEDSIPQKKEQESSSKTLPSKSKKIVDGWEKPKLAIIFTGEQRGYLEPCGCSETQSGGISRRADLFRQLKEDKGWSITGLEMGGTLKRSRRQDQIKFGVLHTALTDMGYQAMALGPAELKLQVDYLFSLVSNSADPTRRFPLYLPMSYFTTHLISAHRLRFAFLKSMVSKLVSPQYWEKSIAIKFSLRETIPRMNS